MKRIRITFDVFTEDKDLSDTAESLECLFTRVGCVHQDLDQTCVLNIAVSDVVAIDVIRAPAPRPDRSAN